MAARKKAIDELSKEMIIQEANKQFLTSDFHKVSMRAIAKELGCSHGAIYYHFANKTELFYAVVEQYFTELNMTLENVIKEEGDSRSKMAAVFTGFIEFGLNHQSQYEFMFMPRNKEVNPFSQQASNESYTKFAQVLQELTNHTLSLAKIYSTFISLHGFVSHYRGFVENYNEAKEAAIQHSQFLLEALD